MDRRRGTYDLLTEPLTLDQLCGVRALCKQFQLLRYLSEHHITGIETKRHRSTGVFGSHFVLDCGGSRKQAARFQDLLQQPSHPYLNRRANAESAWVTTNRKSPLVSMATSLSILISDTSSCVIFRRLSIAPVSGQPWEDFQLIKSSGACVLGCCALRGSDRFTPTVSIRQRHAQEPQNGDVAPG